MLELPVREAAAVAYAVSAVAMFAVIRRQRPAVRRYSYVVLGVVVVSAIGMTLRVYGIGNYPGALDRPQSLPRFVDDCIAYGTLFGLTAFAAGASRRMIALVAGLSAGSRIAIEIGGTLGGVVLLGGVLASIASFLVRVSLLWGPVWQTAQTQPDRRRLLYWKGRNTLMLLIGVAILAALMSPFVFDPLIQTVVLTYIDFLIRIGFAGFLLSNVSALVPDKQEHGEPADAAQLSGATHS